MEPLTSPPVPATTTSPSRRICRLLILILIVFILVGAATYAYRHYYTKVAARVTTDSIRTVEGTFEDRSVYEYSLLGRKKVALAVDGKLVTYDRSADAEAAIVAKDSDIQVVVPGNPMHVLASGKGVKNAVAASPDGANVAYAELDEAVTQNALASSTIYYNPSNWTIKIATVASGEVRTLGKGYGPQFFSYEGRPYILYLTKEGVQIQSLDAKNVHLGIQSDPIGSRPPRVSADGKHIALYRSSAHMYKLYNMTIGNEGAALTDVPSTILVSTVAFKGERAIIASHIPQAGASNYRLYVYDFRADTIVAPFTGTTPMPVLKILP